MGVIDWARAWTEFVRCPGYIGVDLGYIGVDLASMKLKISGLWKTGPVGVLDKILICLVVRVMTLRYRFF
jgi:hypothetical protein